MSYTADYMKIDQPSTPEGRTRCDHDMLDGECAICLGHDLADSEHE